MTKYLFDRRATLGLLISSCVTPFSTLWAEPTTTKKGNNSLNIALPRTLFREIPLASLNLVSKPFQSLMQSQVGMAGNVSHVPDAMAVAKGLDSGEMQLGVFQGFEFAWVKEKYPNLQPLVVSVPVYRDTLAYVIVKADCKATCLADLKNKKLAVPKGTKDHTLLYLDYLQTTEGLKECPCELCKPISPEYALDEVVDEVYTAVVVDSASWNSFLENKPGRSKKLKVLAKSEVFPPGVIAINKDGLDKTTLKKCTDGLINASRNQQAAVILRIMKLKGFESVPANFDQLVKRSLTLYPSSTVERVSFDKFGEK